MTTQRRRKILCVGDTIPITRIQIGMIIKLGQVFGMGIIK